MEALIDYLLARVSYFEVEDKGERVEVRVFEPEALDEREMAELAGKLVDLRRLENAVG